MIGENAPGGYWQTTCLTAPRFSTGDPSSMRRPADVRANHARKPGRLVRYKGGRRPRSIEVIFRDRIQPFDGVKSAAQALGVDPHTISRAAKTGRITQAGFMVRYKEAHT